MSKNMDYERQIDKCSICNEKEYVGWVNFEYKKWTIKTMACEECISVLMNSDFAKYRTVEYRTDRPKVKVLRKK